MNNWFSATLTCVVLSIPLGIQAAQTQPVPANPIWAQTFWGVNAKTRCPELRIADEGTIAVVLFWLPRGGTPSRISIKSSSGSDALDSAAISCVSKLRFAPATTLGDGDPIDSWQQIAFRWAIQGNPEEARARAPEPVAGAPVPAAASARAGDPSGQANSVTVHVCVDETGKLVQDPTIVHSSGMASLDQAAVRIAASGSAYYRPDTSSNGPAVSGCAQLAIKFDAK
jgi:TonB family protein